jgi:Mrp family chromosome partitioning ATPase
MSRIADALQKSRNENADDRTLGPDLRTLRPLAQVQIPWFFEEAVSTTLAPPAPAAAPDITEPAVPEKPRPVVTPPRTELRPGRNDEAVAGLIRNLFQVRTSADRAVRRLLFTSVDDNRCSSDIAPRVAEALAAQSNRSVCLADLDLHDPTLQRRVPAIEGHRGFADAVVERGPLRACTHGAPSHANLWLLPAGAPTLDVIPRLSDADTQQRLADLLSTFYYVIGYTAPLGVHTDAAHLGAVFDGVVLVVDASATKSAVVRAAAQSLEEANVRLLGTVLNHRADTPVS